MTAIDELQDLIRDATQRVGPAVVGLGRGWHGGSGVVVAEGQVLTAAHNLRGEEASVTFADGRTERARIVGSDPDADLAVLAVDTASLRPVEWAPEETVVEIGSPVVALSNPGGRGLRATLGFVSAPERSFRGPRGRRVTGIEHTAPLPRGSSGSPIVDDSGRLLGLNAIRLEGGLILALPADQNTRKRVDAIWRGEQPVPVRLGIAVAPPYVARRLRRAVGLPERDGVLVRAVEEASAAARAGIQRGDLIVQAGGRGIDGVDALHEALGGVAHGGTLPVTLVRGADEIGVEVSFESAPATTEV